MLDQGMSAPEPAVTVRPIGRRKTSRGSAPVTSSSRRASGKAARGGAPASCSDAKDHSEPAAPIETAAPVVVSDGVPKKETKASMGSAPVASIETAAVEAASDGTPLRRPRADHFAAAVAPIVGEVMEIGARRRFAITVQGKITGSTGALVRRMMGWSPDLPEAERAKINRRAAALIKAIENGTESTDPLQGVAMPVVSAALVSKAPFDKLRFEAEREMRRLIRVLPGHAFVESVRGLGELAFSVIVTEVGAVGEYRTVQGLWKRCGLGLVGEERQRKHRDPEMAALHRYSPRRRAEMHAVVADPLLRAQWRGEKDGVAAHAIGPYGEAYGRKRAEYVGRGWKPMHCHLAASRYMTKLVLRDLWVAWRRDAKGTAA
ncbi:MAG: hypothetical protein AB7O45_02685 [Alphaproteobacteria bacterium]